MIGNKVIDNGANRTALPSPRINDLMNVQILPALNFEVATLAFCAIFELAISLTIWSASYVFIMFLIYFVLKANVLLQMQ
mgnify:FL=1